MNSSTLGDVVRYMVLEAIKSDSKDFIIPVKLIYKQIGGDIDADSSDLDFKPGGRYHIDRLRASYVANTASRMDEVKDANVRARLSIGDMEFREELQYCAKITLVTGAIKPGSRNKSNEALASKAVEEFKAKILKLMPSVTDFEGDEITGAIKAIKMYQEMIRDTK